MSSTRMFYADSSTPRGIALGMLDERAPTGERFIEPRGEYHPETGLYVGDDGVWHQPDERMNVLVELCPGAGFSVLAEPTPTDGNEYDDFSDFNPEEDGSYDFGIDDGTESDEFVGVTTGEVIGSRKAALLDGVFPCYDMEWNNWKRHSKSRRQFMRHKRYRTPDPHATIRKVVSDDTDLEFCEVEKRFTMNGDLDHALDLPTHDWDVENENFWDTWDRYDDGSDPIVVLEVLYAKEIVVREIDLTGLEERESEAELEDNRDIADTTWSSTHDDWDYGYDPYRDWEEEDYYNDALGDYENGYDDPFEDCLHGHGWAGPHLDNEDVEWAERKLWCEEREIERAAEESSNEDSGPLVISPRKAAMTNGIPRFPDREPPREREKVKPWQIGKHPPYSLRQLLAAA